MADINQKSFESGEVAVVNKKMLQVFSLFFFFCSGQSEALSGCLSAEQSGSGAESGLNTSSYRAEIALANMVIYSQEYMKYFFADFDSQVQPLPASGISVFLGYNVSPRSRWLTAITLPLREEEVRRTGSEAFKYYYPKLLMIGYESDFFNQPVLTDTACLRLSGGFGLAVPLSHRLLRYIPPFVLSRAALRISSIVDLNFGIGYSGNIKSGAWFFPFGASYLLR